MKRKLIYADNASTTRLSEQAFQAMSPFLLNNYANPSQPYSFSRVAKKALKEARATIAECIGAKSPEEIVFTSGGTESDNWVIKSFIYKNTNIFTSSIEHHAILNTCNGYDKVIIIPVTAEGLVVPSVLEKYIGEDALVSIMMANNEIGTIQPIQELAQIAHSHGCLFHTDAIQAVGHIEVDVQELSVDFLSASAHKFNGPKGIGFLYIRNGIKLPQFIKGGSQEMGFRAGTENVASIVGMATALKENIIDIKKTTSYLKRLEQLLLKELIEAGVHFHRNGINQIPGNINISFKDLNGESILHRLDLQGICVSTGSACDGKFDQISHVLNAINLKEEYAIGTIRISLGKENTEEDVREIVNALIKVMQ